MFKAEVYEREIIKVLDGNMPENEKQGHVLALRLNAAFARDEK